MNVLGLPANFLITSLPSIELTRIWFPYSDRIRTRSDRASRLKRASILYGPVWSWPPIGPALRTPDLLVLFK